MDYLVKGLANSSKMRNRTIRWATETDRIAKELAIAAGYYPERENGGVSKYLSDLVKQEGKVSKNAVPPRAMNAGLESQDVNSTGSTPSYRRVRGGGVALIAGDPGSTPSEFLSVQSRK